MAATRVLIVDDEPSALELLDMHLTEKGYEVIDALDGKGFVQKMVTFRPHIVILDVRLPDADGLDLLGIVKEAANAPYVIVVTAFHDMATTIRAMKQGAFEYIPKPIDLDELDAALERALELTQTGLQSDGLVIPPCNDLEIGEIVGKTREMKEIFKTISVLSNNRVTVLIEGETGTGKELVARAIHRNSPFAHEPFVAINCAAIVKNLLESELFGHEKGAFTGAVRLKKGKCEVAGQGTILLDEICEMPIELQAKLLRFLQDKEFCRVGGEKPIRSEARVIASTNRDPLEMVAAGKFRQDLYYRLNVATIKIPPLRERKADLPLVVEYLLRKINRDLKRRVERVEGGALGRMERYDWPGNVRELENFLTRAVIQTQGKALSEKVVDRLLQQRERPTGLEPGPGDALQELTDPEDVERERILQVLRSTQWHYGKACELLDISYPTLKKRIRHYGIPRKPHAKPTL